MQIPDETLPKPRRREPKPGQITAIETAAAGRKIVSASSLTANSRSASSPMLPNRSGLTVGQVITQERLIEITEWETRRRALDDAYRFLSFRARSEKEITDKLARKGYEAEVIATVMARLRENGFVDDTEFAAQWTRHRQTTKGRRVIAQELRMKGVDKETVAETLAEAVTDEEESATALKLAIRRVGTNPSDKSREAQAKLAAFLQRRGFGWDTVRHILHNLYLNTISDAEIENDPADS